MNTPGFEGKKDGVFWRAVLATASIQTDKSSKIEAYTASETITLKMSSPNVQTYFLGVNAMNTVQHVIKEGVNAVAYSTGFGFGNGVIVITDYDTANNTVTGTFKYNAIKALESPLGGSVLNFQYGNFYKVPVTVSAK